MTTLDRNDSELPARRWLNLPLSTAAVLESHWRDFCRATRSDKASMLSSQVQHNTQLGAVLAGDEFGAAVQKAAASTESVAWQLQVGIAQQHYLSMPDAELDELMAVEMLRGAMTKAALSDKLKASTATLLPGLPRKQTAFKQMAWHQGRLIVRTQQGDWVDHELHPIASKYLSEDEATAKSSLADEDIAQFGVSGLAGTPLHSAGYKAAQALLKQGFVYAQAPTGD